MGIFKNAKIILGIDSKSDNKLDGFERIRRLQDEKNGIDSNVYNYTNGYSDEQLDQIVRCKKLKSDCYKELFTPKVSASNMGAVNDLIEHFANDLMIKSLKLLLKKYNTKLETADVSVICKLNTYLKAGMLFQDLKENWSINYLEMIGSLILQKYNTQEVLQLADKISSDKDVVEGKASCDQFLSLIHI